MKIRRRIGKFLINQIHRRKAEIVYYNHPDRTKLFNFMLEHKETNDVLFNINELITIYDLLNSVENIKGDIAEVGVYRGGSAYILCKWAKGKHVFLFDTFKGLLPQSTKSDDIITKDIKFDCSMEEVKKFLSEFDNFKIYKGTFPKENSDVIKDKKFSFVHLDVDLYEGTLECLRFFYPRMNKQGIILIHDYYHNKFKGVKLAVDEFFKHYPENVIPIDKYCFIIKI